MNLLELLGAFPGMFYRQAWYRDEAFLRTLPNERHRVAPTVIRAGVVPDASDDLPLAVDLVNAYVRTPSDPVWQGYLWCRDTDAQGQRVYLGGTSNGKGLEIHRHLHITERFGVAVWP